MEPAPHCASGESQACSSGCCRDAKEAGLPPLAPLNVTISPDDKLLAAGYVSAVLGPQIIVQVSEFRGHYHSTVPT